VKLLLDENLSPQLVESLADLYSDLKHVHGCNLGGADDNAVWEYAKLYGNMLRRTDLQLSPKTPILPNEASWTVILRRSFGFV
jgi:predicted nuclease of predicted toxin-antitoxin system